MTSDVAVIVDSTDTPAGAPAAVRASSTAGPSQAAGRRALKAAAASWFVVTAIGQVMFGLYVLAAYGPALVISGWRGWDKFLPRGHGHIPGDTAGNIALLFHLALVAVIMVGGVLQVTPAVRRRWPAFHRWTGRTYLASVLIVTVGGLVLKLVREPVGTPLGEIATKINAVLIIWFAIMALHHVRARRIAVHRRWALRLFLVAGGVWFIRVMWAFWRTIASALGVVAPDALFTVLSYAQFGLPLLVLELYFRAQDRGGPRARIAMAATLGALAVATAVGIIAVTQRMWLPRLIM